jgi:hypothetical protein
MLPQLQLRATFQGANYSTVANSLVVIRLYVHKLAIREHWDKWLDAALVHLLNSVFKKHLVQETDYLVSQKCH